MTPETLPGTVMTTPETLPGTVMTTLETLPGTVTTTPETLPGTAIMITSKRSLLEPVFLASAVFPGGSIEVWSRLEVRSMETVIR
ncbi:MAG: hypothetical protein PVJ13_09080 [Desulfobacterales bacterium]|jgi:hypothetical protein